MAENKNSIPWLFYLGTSLAVFFPCLVLGQSYFHDDLLLYYYPCREFLKGWLLQGQFPLWNPYLAGGQPVWGDPSSLSAYPLLYPTLLPPGVYGLSLFFFIHMALGAAGMDFFLGSFQISGAARRVGALTFALSGFFWWEIIHPNILAAFCWLPWVMGFLEKFIQKPKPGTAFALGLASAMLLLSGHHQISLWAAYGGVFYFGARYLQLRKEIHRSPPPWLAGLGYFLWGFTPALLWMAPALELLFRSERLNSPLDYSTFNADFSLDPRHLSQFLFPANPLQAQALSYPDYLDDCGWLGLWAPLLVLAGLARRWRDGAPLAVLALFSLALAFGSYTPLHHWACEWLPGFGLTRSPSRYIFFYTFGGAAFAAMGFNQVETAWLRNRKAILCVLEAAIVLPLVAGSWMILSPGPASNFEYSAQMPPVQRLQQAICEGRLSIDTHIPYETRTSRYRYLAKFPADCASLLGLHTASGYVSINLESYRQIEGLPMETFLRLMAVKGLLTGQPRDFGPDFTREDLENFQLYKAREDRPLVWVLPKWIVEPNDLTALAAMRDPGFNPYQMGYLSEGLTEGIESQAARAPRLLQWEKTEEDPNEEFFKIRLDQSGLVVFSEAAYPGWKAWVDGSPAKVYTADTYLRCLALGAGEHEVRFYYRPWWLAPSLLIGFLWIISVGVWIYFRFKDEKVLK